MTICVISELSKTGCTEWGEIHIISMIAAAKSLVNDKVMEQSEVKMPDRKYIIPPDEDSDDDDDDVEEITLSEIEVDDDIDDEERAQSADEEVAGREEDQNEDDDDEGEIENMELLDVSIEGGRDEVDLGKNEDGLGGQLDPDELLKVSTEQADLEGDKGDLEGEYDPDEDMEETLVIDEVEEEREVDDVQEDEKKEKRNSGDGEWKPLELLPAGWKFKENLRHDGWKKVCCLFQSYHGKWIHTLT